MGGQFFKNILTKAGAKDTSLQEDFLKLANGVKRTESLNSQSPVSLVGIVDANGKRNQPGFTPNDSYNYVMAPSAFPPIPPAIPTSWYGNLLDSHIDSINYSNRVTKETHEKFDETKSNVDGYSTRDTYLLFNDSSQDYFRHGLAIEGRTPIKTGKNNREAWDGSNDTDFRLKTFKNTPYENEDPVIFGFEIIIDAASSPLLNGSVEDFLNSFSSVSEVQSRNVVIYDFKKQFEKVFKTKGKVYYPNQTATPLQSDASNQYASSQTQKNEYRTGKKTYLSHYLKRITGLDLLSERNETGTHKPFIDYTKDKITLSFYEDVSGTMGVISHLYKLLYWSKTNGKNIVPENLLRFNCDIVVSEVRNFNRVRKSIQTPNKETIEILKDNVSRYIYSLKECQLFFPKMPHDDTVDLSSIKDFDSYEVQLNFKYSTTKFEKWVPDPELFGQYIGYNNGAIWKIGNKGARAAETASNGGNTANIIDTSVPRFYTQGTNTLTHNGVTTAIQLDKFTLTPEDNLDNLTDVGPSSLGNSNSGSSAGVGASKIFQQIGEKVGVSTDELGEDEGITGPKSTKSKSTSLLDTVKQNSKKVITNIVKSAEHFVVGEINNQILIRAKLLENTINKIKTSIGLGGLSGLKNVYPKPYTPHSFGPWFDIRNELFNFLTEDVANNLASVEKLANPNAYPDINKINQFKQPKMGQKLDDIYNKNTKFNFGINTVKFGGVLSTTQYGSLLDINTKYSNPMDLNTPTGTKDFTQIQFPAGAQKYPAPLTQSSLTLENIVKSNTVWTYPVNNKKFGK